MEGKQAIGVRIRDCAKNLKIDGPQALCVLIHAELTKLGARPLVTRQTVSNWWHGKVYPSMDMLPTLAAVLRCEQEYLLFGKRRGDQLRQERQFLARINDMEGEALTYIRGMSAQGQKSALKMLKTLAEDNPAPEADVHQMRRKTDRQKSGH